MTWELQAENLIYTEAKLIRITKGDDSNYGAIRRSLCLVLFRVNTGNEKLQLYTTKVK